MSKRTLFFLIAVALVVVLVLAYPQLKKKMDEQAALIKQKAKALEKKSQAEIQACEACKTKEIDKAVADRVVAFEYPKYTARMSSAADHFEDIRLNDMDWYRYEMQTAMPEFNTNAKQMGLAVHPVLAWYQAATDTNHPWHRFQVRLQQLYDWKIADYRRQLEDMQVGGRLPSRCNC